jgi:hypothetical protein
VPSLLPSPLVIRPGRPWHHYSHCQTFLSVSLSWLTLELSTFPILDILGSPYFCHSHIHFEAVLLQVSFFMLFLALSRSCTCTPTLYSYLM